MKLNPNSFFDGDFKEINLNDYFSSKGFTNSNRPQDFQKALDSLGYNTWGGYGENRKDIFKNSYLAKTKKYWHLGIDINVKAGTPVKCPFDCRIYNSFIDKDIDIGWGGRLILHNNSDYFLILGHFDPRSIPVYHYPVNYQNWKRGDILGVVGTYPSNGNTFSHLHIQCVERENFLISDLDGYGTLEDLKNNPNPFEIEF